MRANTRHEWRWLLARIAPDWKTMGLAILFSLLTIGSSMALMGTSAWLIAKAALQPSIAELNLAIVGVRAFGIGRGVFRYLERYTAHQMTFHLLKQIRVWFYATLEPLAPARLMDYRGGDLLARIVSDVETLENFYVRVLAPPIVAMGIALATLIFVGMFSPLLSLILFIAFVFVTGVLPVHAFTTNNRLAQQLIEKRAELEAVMLDGIQGASDILAFGLAVSQAQRVNQLSDNLRQLQQQLDRWTAFYTALGNLTISLSTAVVLIIAIPRVEPIYLGTLALVTVASFEAFLPLVSAIQYLGGNLKAAERLLEVTNATPTIQDPTLPLSAPSRFDIAFRNVTFSYTPNEAPVLKQISFDLHMGQPLVLVGASGAGKSTILNLLLRFWEPQQGDILLGEQPLSRYHQTAIRDWIAVVPQSVHLFNTTIRENILLARPNATEAELITAARRANLHEFIMTLPNAYETWVGDQGQALSGGERQRVGIARALLKDAPILLLDEPMTGLDDTNAHEIWARMQELYRHRTLLIITHHLSDLDGSGNVLLLHDGSVKNRSY